MTWVDFIPAFIFVTLGLIVGFGVLFAAARLVRRLSPKDRDRS